MNVLFRSLVITAIAAAMALPVVSVAEEADNYEPDARYAENEPPMIPHRFEDTSNGEYCLGCHRTGIKGAPICPHPVRLSCTGCHAQGEIKDVKPVKKERKKR